MSKLSEQIKQALEAATPGPWECDPTGFVETAVSHNGVFLCQKALDKDAHLIANAPTWLTQLLQEREQMVEALNWIADRSTNHLGAITKAEVTLNMVGELE